MEKIKTGPWSTGDRSIGPWSTGDRSIGGWSTGSWSIGYRSTGDRSAGHGSTGNGSTGHGSTGHGSAGDRSTGHGSTGNGSTGSWSTSNWSTGHFSTVDYAGFGAFNLPCSPDIWDKAQKPDFLYFDLVEWIVIEDMTETEITDNPTCETVGGFLKVYEYQEAFLKSFNSLSAEEKKEQIALLEALPNFNYDIFYEISGIDYLNRKTEKLRD